MSTLIASANFWRSQKNYVYARRALDRALQVAPTDPDVLADSAELALDTGDTKAADEYRERLGRVAPDSARTKALASERVLTPDEAKVLAEARRLAQTGDAAGSVAKYATLLRDGTPPSNIAVEYYTQLGATRDGFDDAVDKLGTLAEQAPANLQLQLAFARLEVTQEETRSDGLRRLASLAGTPEVGDVAKQAWRDALLWQGPSEKARSQLETYLAHNPSDPALEAKKKEFNAILPDASAKAMIRGYNLMANDVGGAEKAFREALVENPGNPEAMSMLAAVLRIQKHPAEAQVHLNRAIALAPERKDEFNANAGGDFTGKMAIGMDEQMQISGLLVMGRVAEAEQLLKSLMGTHGTAPLLVQLADLQRRAGHLEGALDSLRDARKLAPVNADADCTLAEVQMAQSQYADASATLDAAQKLYAKAGNKTGLSRVTFDRAALQKVQPEETASAAPLVRPVIMTAPLRKHPG